MAKKESPIILPPESERALDISQQLLEKENQDAIERIAKHKAKIRRTADALIELLAKEECTWGDWGEVIDIMNDVSKYFFPRIRIKDMTQK